MEKSKLLEIGRRVMSEREALGLSQEGLASEAGISKDAVWRIEKAKNDSIRPSTLRSIAKALGKTIDWVKNGDQTPQTTAEPPPSVRLLMTQIDNQTQQIESQASQIADLKAQLERAGKLSEAEEKLIGFFRSTNQKGQTTLLKQAKAFASKQPESVPTPKSKA
jgi:transcriptional regulator with XRE-family HTH domain